MDEHGNAGSVCFLQDIEHPISVARMVMENSPHVMLAGEGARMFAQENGFPIRNLLTEESIKAYLEWKKESKYEPVINIENHDTIGMLAIDKNGKLSGACTTSGLAFKYHGRVGDSPVIGAGLYVDNSVGGATATGMGELVIKTVGSFLVVENMRQGLSPGDACREAVLRIVEKVPEYGKVQVGYIAVNKAGEYGAFAIHKGFNYAIKTREITKLVDSDYHLK
jgi:isoaspartyl peptidase/L-asparaginase-like protein (Ntn-hydrolase superfamily)